MKKIMTLLLALCMLLTVCGCVVQGKDTATTTVTTNTDGDNQGNSGEQLVLDETVTYYAEIEIADYGTIVVKLDQNAAPITAANFVSLAKSGFYDGLTFHRIIAGFMMQGGDPKGNGTGGSDTKIKGEFAANGHDNPISHERGVISMARSKAYDSASSQFFIMHADYTGLDGQYAAFGYVTDGLEVVDAVCEAAQPTDNNGTIPKENQPVITRITIIEE